MPTAPDNHGNPDMLTRAHFEPGQKVYTFYPEFELTDIKAAIFEGTYRDPKPLTIRMQHSGIVELQVIVKLVEQLYQPFLEAPGQAPFTCYNEPDWYLEGWVQQSGFNPFEGPLHVRLYVLANGRKLDDIGYFQRIVEPQRGEIEVVDSAVPPA